MNFRVVEELAAFPRAQKREPRSSLQKLFGLAEQIHAAWGHPLLRSRFAPFVLFCALGAICALRAWIGLAGMQAFSHDAFMPLDGAWRLLNGQRPHLDFYSFIGVLAYAPTAAGMWLARGGAEGFAYAQALVGLALGAWAYALSRERLPDVPAAFFCLAVVLLCTAPFPLGYSPFATSPATVYNRYGYAMLGLIILEAFTPRKGARIEAEFRGGVSTACLAVLLFFLKITFFVAAVFLIAVLALCRRQTGRRLTGLICGAAAMSLPFCAYFGFHMMPMIRDLITVAGAKRVHLRAYQWDSIVADEGVLVSFAVVASVILLVHHRRDSARAVLIAGAAVGFGGMILILGNCEPHGLPLNLFFVLLAASRLDCKSLGNAQLFCGATLLWASVFTAGALAPSALGFAYATALRTVAAPFGTPMAGKALAHFVPIDADTEYGVFVNEGLALVQQNRKPGDTVMSLDFTNPFAYGLGMKSAPGGTTALHYQTTFNDLHRPTAERLFGAARLVMVPNTFSDPSLQDSIPRLYGPYLASHFRLAGQSTRWRLYRSLD